MKSVNYLLWSEIYNAVQGSAKITTTYVAGLSTDTKTVIGNKYPIFDLYNQSVRMTNSIAEVITSNI